MNELQSLKTNRDDSRPSFCLGQVVVFFCASVLVHPSAALSQDFVHHALSHLPAQTPRVEYFSPARLRALPGYLRFRQRYVDPNLLVVDKSLLQLGVDGENIDEMLIAWPTPRIGNKDLEGMLRGRFDIRRIAGSAGRAKISVVQVGGLKAFCASEGAFCFTVLNEFTAAFGPADFLGTMPNSRAKHKSSLLTDSRFMELFDELHGEPPLWGIASDESVLDMFPVWLAGRGRRRMDWSSILNPAKAMMFHAELHEDVEFHLNLDYSSSKEADRVHRTLETLRRQHRAMWKNMEPRRPDPVDGIQVSVTDRRLSLAAKAENSP